MQLKTIFGIATSLICATLSPNLYSAEPARLAALSQPDNETLAVAIVSKPETIPSKPEDTAPENENTPYRVLDTASAVTPPLSNDLWNRIRSGFALPEMDDSLVRQNENWYASRPEYVKRLMDRSKLYLHYIVEEVEKRGMPTEIALLPMIESAFNPQAYSRSHASGIWQFIPSTGKHFGLVQNGMYDGRRDVAAATGAALDYLQKLYGMFGNWELALAAYNWGEGSVARAMARNEAKGEPTDYMNLAMPNETRNYVPRLIAIKNIVMNPALYGLTLASIPNDPYFIKIAPKQQMDVKLAARLADMPLNEFVALNPAHQGPVIAYNGSRTLLLPIEKAEAFNDNLSNYSKPLVTWHSYAAKKGERLDKIAKKFGTSIATLKENNQIVLKKNKLASNQTLLIHMHGQSNGSEVIASNFKFAEEPTTATAAVGNTSHRVKKGETLYSIARQHNVTPDKIKSWNHLKSSNVALGQTLTIQQVTTVAKAEPERSIALKAGRQKESKAKSGVGKRTLYTVRRGDTLNAIAQKFNVALNDIQRWNNLTKKHKLQPGEKVTVYL